MMEHKKPLNIEIGNKIREARRAAGLTQDKFAELIDMGTKNVSAIECGAVGISLASMKQICQVLSISADSLLFGTAAENDVTALTLRLERLTPKQFAVVSDIINRLLEAFAISGV